ncbi:MAG: hypothetical protein RBT49_14360 [Bacteroidales bacterium]|jgi:hypothetical protein|nr:hypothetical protein [Bacteroidales bacterium]
MEEDSRKFLIENITHFRKFSTQELEDTLEIIKDDPDRLIVTKQIQEEIDKRIGLRERVLRQKIEKKSSWGFPFPVLNYTIETSITKEQHSFLTNQIRHVMFWGMSISWRSIINKNIIEMERKLFSDYEKEKNPRTAIGNPKILTKLDKAGKIIIRCVDTTTLFYDPEENNITLHQFLFLIKEIAWKEGILL